VERNVGVAKSEHPRLTNTGLIFEEFQLCVLMTGSPVSDFLCLISIPFNDTAIKSNLKNLYSAPTIMDGRASRDNLGLKILKNIKNYKIRRSLEYGIGV